MGKYFLKILNFLLLSFSSVIFQGAIQAQKPYIDTGVINRWSRIEGFQVSNNGKYFSYYVDEQSGSKVILQSISLKWKIALADARPCVFMQNSKKALVLRKDSLVIIDLDADHDIHYMSDIMKFELVKYGKNNDLLLYRLKTTPDELIVRDMESGEEKRFSNVERYWSSGDGNVLVLETKNIKDSLNVLSLNWVEISSDRVLKMWRGRNIKTLLLDKKGLQCVFNAIGIADSIMGIWFYTRKDTMAEKIIDDQSNGIEKGYHIQDLKTFNGEDNRVFFNLVKDSEHQVSGTLVPVDIWSYKDASLQSEQLHKLHERLIYKAALNIADRKVIRLEYERENMTSPIYSDKPMSFGLVVKDGDGGDDESGWNTHCPKSVYLVSLRDGWRILIDNDLLFEIASSYVLSYNENYVYYYDVKSKNYFSYCIRDRVRRNLTENSRAHWTIFDYSDLPDSSFFPYRVATLIKEEDAVVVYDQHAIYELDPAAKTPVVNLPGYHQQSDDLEIRLINSSKQFIDRHQPLIFHVLNRTDKKEALWKSYIDSLKYRKSFQLQPYHFQTWSLYKARDTDLYFVTRMTAEESPNVFITSDFSTYQPITDLYPERAYNWMKSELITWKTIDGKIDQGILYKPENFDSLQEYPLLVYYYERSSDNLHYFLQPQLSNGILNIPMYVSHGYLVFVPDIHYTIGWPGKSAYNAVVSGVNYLCRRKYIDRMRMGLQGHSFGGFETNYIATHTHLFASAMSASSISDFVSGYGSITGDEGMSRQGRYEFGQSRVGASLWEKPALYLENSPVLRADSVTTPLLIMANKQDGDVPFEQGVELFTALRRLGKKAWMLQYDGEGHGISGRNAQLDFTIRMFQFFNYYLKGEPPPEWMTKGIPATLKGIESGLKTDTSGAQP